MSYMDNYIDELQRRKHDSGYSDKDAELHDAEQQQQ